MSHVNSDFCLTFLNKINFESSRIEFEGSHIILFFGGKVQEKKNIEDPELKTLSLRHAICKSLPPFEIFLPEEITDWQSDAVFKNLMDFEEDLVSVCSLIVVILESDGALVELGAFSQLGEVRNKMLVVNSREFDHVPSFINLGILRFIRGAREDRPNVLTYHWNPKNTESITQEVIQDVTQDIQERINALPGSAIFKKEMKSHTLIFICEMISMFAALKESEIFDYLVALNFVISREQLRRKLFLLIKFKVLKTDGYGGANFYMLGRSTYHNMRLTLLDGSIHDKLRTQTDCLAYYHNDAKHRNRLRAIKHASVGVQR